MGVPTDIVPGEDVAQKILDVGFTDEAAIAAWAILYHESSHNRFALNLVVKDDPEDLSHHTLDKGLAQFNTRWWADVSEKEAFDWEYAIEMMYLIWFDRGFQDWAAFNSLRYLRHVPAAYEAFSTGLV